MQTIKTEHGIYTIKNDRDPGEFMRKLAKPAGRKRAEKAPIRHFPVFFPGETSVQSYIKKYFELNNWTGVHNLFPELPITPAECYDPALPLCEVSHGE
jgi:hypothetical protein